jgi:hypothetical protein
MTDREFLELVARMQATPKRWFGDPRSGDTLTEAEREARAARFAALWAMYDAEPATRPARP